VGWRGDGGKGGDGGLVERDVLTLLVGGRAVYG